MQKLWRSASSGWLGTGWGIGIGVGVGSLVILLAGCQGTGDPELARQEIQAADRAFAQLSVSTGMTAAFSNYAATDAVIYRDRMHPIQGPDNIRSLFTPTPAGTLSWEPTRVEVAATGDLGYSLGEYTYTYADSLGGSQTSRGYYVTIWRKQVDGTWRYVFDTGITAPP